MMIEEGQQEAAIGAFLLAHEGHTQDVEVQRRGAWTVYCRCRRCDDVRTYEVDNEASQGADARVAALAGVQEAAGVTFASPWNIR